MKEKLLHLKSGALLVRLQTKENSIKALRKAGNEKLANKVEKKQTKFNKSLIAAFRVEFNFCPVYFFQSQYSEQLLNDQLEQVILVNDNSEPDSSVKCVSNNYLTADISYLEQDSIAYFQQNYYTPDGVKKSYSGGPNLGFKIFKIMDHHFIQLIDPFPYYVRTVNFLYIKRKLTNVAKRMDKKLTIYDEKINDNL